MRKATIAAIVAALTISIGVAVAAEPVILAGEIVCRLADPGPFGSLAQRVAAVDKRICDAISYEDVGNPKMKVAKRQGRWSVFIGKTFLLSVYPLDAKHYGLPAKKVAYMWSGRFKKLFPLAQPVTKMKHAPGTLPPEEAAKHERLPTCKPAKVPREHWGLINRWLVVLWKVRSASKEEYADEQGRYEAEIIATAARHYFVPAKPCDCHEPGTCPALKDCPKCQEAMKEAVEVPPQAKEQSHKLVMAMAADPITRRTIRRAFDYVRQIDGHRFHRERVRVAWSLWQKLAARAKILLARERLSAASAAQQ